MRKGARRRQGLSRNEKPTTPLLTTFRTQRDKEDGPVSKPPPLSGEDENITRPPETSSDEDSTNVTVMSEKQCDSSSEAPSPDHNIRKTVFEKRKGLKKEKMPPISCQPAINKNLTTTGEIREKRKAENELDEFMSKIKRSNQNRRGYGTSSNVTAKRALKPVPALVQSQGKGKIQLQQPSPQNIRHIPRYLQHPDDSNSSLSRMSGRNAHLNQTMIRKQGKKRAVEEATDSVRKEKRSLIMPDDEPAENDEQTKAFLKSLSNSPLSSLGTGPMFSDAEFKTLENIPKNNDEDEEDNNMCPICGQSVDDNLLFKYKQTPGVSMSVQSQVAFCHEHKTITAMKTYRSRGYPIMDWANFSSRLEMHDDLVMDLLFARTESVFAEEFKKKVRTGDRRTLLRTNESLTPGYYGPRALRLITESVVRRFNPELRKAAIENKFVSSSGNMMFIQSVVVPEIVVRLIMEDMHVSHTKAKTILEETREVGDLVCDDTGDMVSARYDGVDNSDNEEDDDYRVSL